MTDYAQVAQNTPRNDRPVAAIALASALAKGALANPVHAELVAELLGADDEFAASTFELTPAGATELGLYMATIPSLDAAIREKAPLTAGIVASAMRNLGDSSGPAGGFGI